jgi:hypothetical protein
MTLWHRRLPFRSDHGREWTEQWEYRPAEKAACSFEVLVRVGKSVDVLALKGIDLNEIRKYSDFLESTAKQMQILNSLFSALDTSAVLSAAMCLWMLVPLLKL